MGSTIVSTSMQRLSLFLSAVITIACDTQHDQVAAGPNVRDSAGIGIVSNTEPSWTEQSAWRLGPQPTVTIEVLDAEPEKGPVDPASAFRTSRGEIVVADGMMAGWHRLLVYDAQGRFLRFISRKGEGPCEFAQVWWAQPYRGDSIIVFDMGTEAFIGPAR
jgi:hypothetical protein